MLPERYRQLLTAYVDGELSARQRRHVVRLLRRSGEARALVGKLQGDSRTLKALAGSPAFAPASLDVDLSGPVLQLIAERPLPFKRPQPRPRVPAPTPASFPAWMGFAAAAAVLFVVGLGSFLYFSSRQPGGKGPSLAHTESQPDGPRDGPKVDPPRGSSVAKGKKPRSEGLEKEDEQPEHGPIVRKGPQPGPPDGPEKKLLPDGEGEPKSKGVLGSGLNDKDGLDKVESLVLALPTVMRVHELDQPGKRELLLSALHRGSAFRVELTCREGGRAFDRLRPAFASHKIGLLIDQAAQARFKKGQWKGDFSVFLEDVSPKELAALLQQAGVEDRQAQAKRPPEGRFNGQLVVAPLGRLDYRDLTDLLGTNPIRKPAAALSPAIKPGLLGIDLTRPLSDLTAAQVGQALDGKGLPRPGQQGATKAAERSALVMIYGAGRNRLPSPELKRFFEMRKPARPATLQVLLVLRGV